MLASDLDGNGPDDRHQDQWDAEGDEEVGGEARPGHFKWVTERLHQVVAQASVEYHACQLQVLERDLLAPA